MKCKDGEGIFLNYVDLICYTCLSIVYPALVYLVQIGNTNYKQIQSVCDLILSGLMFALTFFYDFYLRFQERDKINPKISSILGRGRFLFGGLSFYLFVLLILSISNFKYAYSVKFTFYIIPLSSLLPIYIAYYGFKTLYNDEKTNKTSNRTRNKSAKLKASKNKRKHSFNKKKSQFDKSSCSVNKNSIGDIKV